MEANTCSLELQKLSKIYSGKKTSKKALADVTFTLGPGLTAFRAERRRKKHDDEYYHGQFRRKRRKSAVEREKYFAYGAEIQTHFRLYAPTAKPV